MRLLLQAVFLLICGIFLPSALAQTGDPGRVFPLHTVFWFNNYDPSRITWTDCQIYHDAQTIVRTVTTTAYGKQVEGLPIESVDGTRALVLDATNQNYWNIIFLIGSGARVNLKRIIDIPGQSPVLHLRVKWGTILPNNANDITVQMDKTAIPLSRYAPPSQAWQDINIPLSDFTAGDPGFDPTQVFGVKIAAANTYADESIIYISEMCVLPGLAKSEMNRDLVKVDESGWRPTDHKLALVSYPAGASDRTPSSFLVRNIATGKVVFNGKLAPMKGAKDWDLSGDMVYGADFTALAKPGRYQVEVPSLETSSAPFSISGDIYNRAFRDSLRYFYYERSGVPIEGRSAEGNVRPAVCPNNIAASYHFKPSEGNYKYTSPMRDILGGWLDAGDTSLQLPDHAAAIWWLLEALEDFGNKVPAGSLDLPEKPAAGVSDIVPLTDWGLRWMAKMWNSDGSVLWGAAWADGPNQQIADSNSVSAALLAGAFAKAYVDLRDLPGYRSEADGYLAMAKKSWEWLAAHPKPVTAVTESAIDPSYDTQCRIFAAIELYNATGDEEYNRYFDAPFHAAHDDPLHAFGNITTGYDTDHVMGYLNWPIEFAYMDYAESKQPGADRDAQRALKQAFLHQAAVSGYDPTDKATPYLKQNPYHFAMLFPGHLYWGSNANVLSVIGAVLIKAYEWTGDPGYLRAALENLHFVNGRNPVDRDFVSGEAPNYWHGCDFYSQFWLDLNHQPPGVVGAFINVDSGLNDTVKDPWKRFMNYQEASTEEPDVGWNCEYAYLAGYFATRLSAFAGALHH